MQNLTPFSGPTEFFCTIYENQPEICRDLGGGSPECLGYLETKAAAVAAAVASPFEDAAPQVRIRHFFVHSPDFQNVHRRVGLGWYETSVQLCLPRDLPHSL